MGHYKYQYWSYHVNDTNSHRTNAETWERRHRQHVIRFGIPTVAVNDSIRCDESLHQELLRSAQNRVLEIWANYTAFDSIFREHEDERVQRPVTGKSKGNTRGENR